MATSTIKTLSRRSLTLRLLRLPNLTKTQWCKLHQWMYPKIKTTRSWVSSQSTTTTIWVCWCSLPKCLMSSNRVLSSLLCSRSRVSLMALKELRVIRTRVAHYPHLWKINLSSHAKSKWAWSTIQASEKCMSLMKPPNILSSRPSKHQNAQNLWRKATERKRKTKSDNRYRWANSLSIKLFIPSRPSEALDKHPIHSISKHPSSQRLNQRGLAGYWMDFWFCSRVEWNCPMKLSHQNFNRKPSSTLLKKTYVISRIWRLWTFLTTRSDLSSSRI